MRFAKGSPLCTRARGAFSRRPHALPKLRQRRALMHREVIRLIALDQILRLIHRRVPRVSLEHRLGRELPLDRPANTTGFGVPFDVIADFEVASHRANPPAPMAIYGWRTNRSTPAPTRRGSTNVR